MKDANEEGETQSETVCCAFAFFFISRGLCGIFGTFPRETPVLEVIVDGREIFSLLSEPDGEQSASQSNSPRAGRIMAQNVSNVKRCQACFVTERKF